MVAVGPQVVLDRVVLGLLGGERRDLRPQLGGRLALGVVERLLFASR
jgi:hypothetical protein